MRALCSFSWALPRCFSSLARSFSESTSACLHAPSRCSTRLWESCCNRCKGVVTGFLLADMTCLQADVVAPILDPQTPSRQRVRCATSDVRQDCPPIRLEKPHAAPPFHRSFSTAAAAFRRAPQGRTGLCRRRPPGHAPTAGNARPRAIRTTSRTAPGLSRRGT
nr:hypothetical 17.8K protein (type1) - Pseudomonas aeruginosa [Pseudomonas aeruginosa]